MRAKPLIYGTVLGIAVGATGHAFGAVISGSMSENFDYSAGTAFPNTGGTPNGGAGWNATGDSTLANTAGWGTGNQNNGASTGANRTATAGGLTFPTAAGYVDGTGNKLTLDSVTPASSESMSRNFGGQTIDSGTTYFSALMRLDNTTLRTFNLALFSLVGTTSTEQLTIGQIGATVSGSLQGSNGKIAIIYKNTNPTGIRASTVDMGSGITHLIILRIDWNASGVNENVTAWVDPTDVTTEAAALPAQFYNNAEFDLTQINYVRPFTGNAAVGPPAAIPAQGSYDEIRSGGSWASVTTAPAVAVTPEPASFALLGLSGMALLRRRRTAR